MNNLFKRADRAQNLEPRLNCEVPIPTCWKDFKHLEMMFGKGLRGWLITVQCQLPATCGIAALPANAEIRIPHEPAGTILQISLDGNRLELNWLNCKLMDPAS